MKFYSGQDPKWEAALEFSGENLRVKEGRGADADEVLRARFNDYAPLLRLGRREEARALLQVCRAGFEAAREIEALGKVFGAFADLEDKEGQHKAAVRFQENSLLYTYQARSPESCATGHHNLANYLDRAKLDEVLALAHRLAGAVIRIQIGSGGMAVALRNLAARSCPETPPTFAEVVAAVEQSEGVRFADLFAHLPRRFPDGDAAIAAVWDLVQEEKAKPSPQEELASLSAAIQAAFQLDGEAFSQALNAALSSLPPDEAGRLVEQLRQAGLLG